MAWVGRSKWRDKICDILCEVQYEAICPPTKSRGSLRPHGNCPPERVPRSSQACRVSSSKHGLRQLKRKHVEESRCLGRSGISLTPHGRRLMYETKVKFRLDGHSWLRTNHPGAARPQVWS